MKDLRPDVPPLSDLSRQRIRQAVFDRLDREPTEVTTARAPARRRVLLIAGAAAALLLAGAAVVRLAGSERQVARAPSPSRLETGESPSQVTVGDARITAGPHAALTVSENGEAVHVLIEQGEIEFAVAPRAGRPPFVVMAADVRVEVVGTVFTVARSGDQVRVAVTRGVVRVTRAGEAALVEAGRGWPEETAARPAPEPSEPELTFEPDPAGAAQKRKEPRPRVAEEVAAPPAPPPPSARERYESAARSEQTRPAEALATYRALVAEGGTWAENALFAQARLELELGRKDAARRSLAAYLKRYPRGANAGLARSLLDGIK